MKRMRFFFADSQDQIDPSYDFVADEHPTDHVRQRDDRYPHEVLATIPYAGILVSKSIVDGSVLGPGRYTAAQRQRLMRLGARRFFRLPAVRPAILTMGDCGAFSYIREDRPPYSVDDVIDFYEACAFDFGLSVDHVILGFDDRGDSKVDGTDLRRWRARQNLTLQLAADFRRRHAVRRARFEAVGVAQGWSAMSYAFAVECLQKMGYRSVAVGGMVPMRTTDILACLQAISRVRRRETQLHLLGVTRPESARLFAAHGVTSFDSTSPLRQAFKDATDNYHTLATSYTALRVPQADGNTMLFRRVRSGLIDQSSARELESKCLRAIRELDRGKSSIKRVVDAVFTYEQLLGPRADRRTEYKHLLADKPWRDCECGLCQRTGIDIVVFRGSERNRRRGFHNLYVFAERLRNELNGRRRANGLN